MKIVSRAVRPMPSATGARKHEVAIFDQYRPLRASDGPALVSFLEVVKNVLQETGMEFC
jgi:hypothetical protein